MVIRKSRILINATTTAAQSTAQVTIRGLTITVTGAPTSTWWNYCIVRTSSLFYYLERTKRAISMSSAESCESKICYLSTSYSVDTNLVSWESRQTLFGTKNFQLSL